MLSLGPVNCAEAADNSTYLDQSGASSTVTIVQTGTANAIGSSDTDFITEGASQVLSITQEGTTNSLTGSTLGADSTVYGVYVVGADNTVSLDHGTIGAIAFGAPKACASTGQRSPMAIFEPPAIHITPPRMTEAMTPNITIRRSAC